MPPVSRKRRPPRTATPIAPAAARVRGRERDARLRAELAPLAPGERPTPLLVAVAVAILLAIAVVVGALTIGDLSRRGGSAPGAVFLAIVLLVLARGMYNRRYWAVLGMEGLLAFQILVTALALVVASTVYAAVLCVVSIALSGWLFWKLVRVMARLQVPGSPEPPITLR